MEERVIVAARKNCIVILLDQLRPDSLGYMHNPYVRTPNIDSLAHVGAVFEQARCTIPVCAPSRINLFSGQYARRHGVYDNRPCLGADDVHLPSVLREQGYRLGFFGKNHAFRDEYLASWEGVELYDAYGKEERPFCSPPGGGERRVTEWRQTSIPYFEAPVREPQPGPPEADPAHSLTDYALDFLQQQDGAEPFFLCLSYDAPHFPYVLPEPWLSLVDPDEMPGPIADTPLFRDTTRRLWLHYYGLFLDHMTDDDIRWIQATCLAMVAFVDYQLGRLFEALKESGHLENSVILFTADHGDFWGHKGLIGKANVLYEDLLRVPLAWHVPGVTDGARSQALVEHTDMLPTMLDLLELPAPDGLQGRSYASIVRTGEGDHRRWTVAESSLGLPAASVEAMEDAIRRHEELFAEEGPLWFIRRQGGMTRSLMGPDGWKVIAYENEDPELYHMPTDPRERVNLAREADQQHRLEAMLDALESVSLR